MVMFADGLIPHTIMLYSGRHPPSSCARPTSRRPSFLWCAAVRGTGRPARLQIEGHLGAVHTGAHRTY
jgi:hypothetical protein